MNQHSDAPQPPPAQGTGAAGSSDTLLGAWLLALAGFVDAIAFTALQGSFVAFMSGNTTILALSAADADWSLLGLSAALIGLFFFGCVAGEGIIRWAGRAGSTVLMFAIFAAILLCAGIANFSSLTWGVSLAALAGGLINSALAPNSNVKVGLTYVTGTLVKAAHQLVGGIGSAQPWKWLVPLGFWAMFVGGALLGGVAFHWMQASSLWIAAGAALIACFLPRMRRSDQ